MPLIKCPECGKEISDKAISCPNCGYSFEKTKFCKFCGEKIPVDSMICTKCGRQVEQAQGTQANGGGIVINNAANSNATSSASAVAQNITPTQPQPGLKRIDKTTALVLCILFGYFGAHKFYEGKTGLGVLYLLTFGLLGIGWIVDIIIIAMKPNPYYV